MLLVETVYDLLQAKSAIVGARQAMAATGITVPLMVQVTIETTGRMLVGSEIGAASLRSRRCGPTSSGSTAPPARTR